jgi:hypothetical protein
MVSAHAEFILRSTVEDWKSSRHFFDARPSPTARGAPTPRCPTRLRRGEVGSSVANLDKLSLLSHIMTTVAVPNHEKTMTRHLMLIDGQPSESSDGRFIDIENPANRTPIGRGVKDGEAAEGHP